MPTLNQLIKKSRKNKKKVGSRAPLLSGAPQRKGVCLKAFIVSPKKPNSANRKVARVLLQTGKVIMAYIPGQGHKVQQHSNVLVRGGRVKDVPGLHYRLVKGPLDFSSWERTPRHQSRSKYGVKKNN